MNYKSTKLGDKVFNTFNAIFMIVIVVVTLYPFLNILAISFNNASDTLRGGIYIWPREWTMFNFSSIFATGFLYHAFFVSVLRTVISTVLNLFFTTMLAYTLSRKEYFLRKFITTVFVLTMYFSAGMIPSYFLIKNLGLMNHFIVYILPSMIGAFNLIVIRTYIKSLPDSMIEAAKIDGAGEFSIFIKIVFPLCKPVLAVVGLFVAVGAWNTWFDTFLYASSNQNLSTLQYELMKLLSTSMQTATTAVAQFGGKGALSGSADSVTPQSIRAASTVVAALPILMVYPFLQKYFVVGLNVGSVKE
ncbi:carbohydrate ABC transporter permease [Clostridium estertheticum]|uniref:Carbohydrate ABC transporter permease n=1 Tax=Clostridium estertheticum TaxID=238834 RepID=A0A5N7J092_9CLOT|nr:carbohydrate ABC transporter permease [Clostridium estertheticum]MBX4263179.1 carbohydrate ABC transporter permease [Clostridium estertheticum]MBX4269907.1 carbohydrate ABC transporter permease [Clostridium estertheticum]MPQ31450.1 carbohydrate ABC transporter permease [Clostridium estertheticum]MPQ62123.1 carbohydrate ABC transporter permease [Clostridium estertheticum]WLC78460.1 carbohydrate ABC transporter permease [Clostridium estertheticum]